MKTNDWAPASDCIHSRPDIVSHNERVQYFPVWQIQRQICLQWSGDILSCFNECHNYSEHTLTPSGDLSTSYPNHIYFWGFQCSPSFLGSNTCSPRCEMIVKVCDDLPKFSHTEYGSSTYMWFRNSSWSVLYLALNTATIFLRFVWEIIPDLFESDHAQMKITAPGTGTATTLRPRWIILKANWRDFTEKFLVGGHLNHPSLGWLSMTT